MKLSSPLTTVLISSLGLLAGCNGSANGDSRADGGVNLKFNFQPGSKFSYDINTKQDIEAQGMKMSQNMTMVSTFAVQTAAGNARNLQVTYDRVGMKMNANGQQMAYDSQDPSTQSSPLAMMGGLVGKPFTVTVTDQGEVTNVTGVDAIVQGMIDPSKPNAAMMQQQLSQTLNDKAMKSMMSQSINIYPDHAVKPGDSWNKTVAMALGPVNLNLNTTYKLTGVNQGVAHLAVSGQIAASGAAPISGTQTGTMDVDVATGMLNQSTLTQNMTSQGAAPGTKIVTTIHVAGQKK